MPVVIPAVIGIVGSAVATGGAAALGLTGIAATLFTAGAGILTAGLQFAAQSLLGQDQPRQSLSRTVGQVPQLGTRFRVLGETRVGGHIVHLDVDGTSTAGNLYQVIVLNYGVSDSFIAHYLGDEEVTLDGSGWVQTPAKWQNLVRIETFDGTQTSAPTTLTGAFSYWT